MMATLRMFDTTVTVEGTVAAPLGLLWGGLTWWGRRRHPERGFWRSLLIGGATLVVLMPADFGHAFAHIASARYAGAPMDELRISASMPRTLYRNNDVSPDAHRLRALGGPVFNALSFLLSLATYRAVPRHPVAREFAGWSALGHGFILILSLMPVPVVDGGTLAKWTLVARGRSEAEADALVRRIDLGLAALGGIMGAGFLGRRIRRAADTRRTS